jgi:site-specific DNA-methyltransferase (adenine-specific)
VTPYYSDDLVTIYHGDALEVIPQLSTVDAVITDPPYFMPAEPYAVVNPDPRKRRQRLWGDTSVLSRWWSTTVDILQPKMRDWAHLIVFCDDESYPVFYPVLYSRFASLSALVWDKGRIGPGRPWRHQHELIIDARPAVDRWTGGAGRGDILRVSRISGERFHPVDKPTDLLAALVEPVTEAADLVLDPFAGGGSTLIAAKSLGRRAIGIEIEERYCEIAATRCSQEVLGLTS